jgi:hypothetical protein
MMTLRPMATDVAPVDVMMVTPVVTLWLVIVKGSGTPGTAALWTVASIGIAESENPSGKVTVRVSFCARAVAKVTVTVRLNDWLN